jgi:pilus assembly protein CpaB
MHRGRIFIYLALILIIGVAAAFFYLQSKGLVGPASSATPIPEVRMVEIITAGQNILPGTQITEEMLSSLTLPEDRVVADLFTSKADVAGQFAKYPLAQGVPITNSMVTPTTGNIYLPGSSWAGMIPQGMTAIAIPITRLSSAAYAIRDGDYVDILVSLLLVDVDSSYQSILPNYTAIVTGAGYLPESPVLTAGINSAEPRIGTAQGRTELDATLNEPLYIVPSESQRPRMVTQMILKNVQILHVGTFPLPGEAVTTTQETTGQSETGATATPQPGQQVAATVVRPDIITLMVTPQDAVTLKYLLDINASITLTLRNPNDQETNAETEAATLQYLLSQYNIPVPAKLPYAVEPRTDAITPPVLPNDTIVVTAK